MRRKDIDDKRAMIEDSLRNGVPRFEIARQLGCRYDTLKARIDKWGLSHLKNENRKGRPHLEARKSVDNYLGENAQAITSHKLKLLLFRDNIKKEACECCKLDMWQGKRIPLELDHINGNHWDNRLENLRILCANCHGQTPTNSGKNIGKYKMPR